jgi:predicted MFS family arabinose efflux permease
VVIALFLATILVVGLEAGNMGLLTTYLMELRGFTQVTSKIGLVVFGLGIATGRLVVGSLTRREHIRSVLLWLFLLAALAFVLLYFVNLGTFTYVAIFLSGAAISAILPLMITFAGLLYAQISGTAVGTIKIAIPLGGILIPAMLAFLASLVSFQQSLIIFPLVALAGVLVLYIGLQGVHLEA